MERYNMIPETINHYARMKATDGGDWVKYAEASARIAALESQLTDAKEAVRVLGIGHRVGATLRNKLAAIVGDKVYSEIILQMQDSCTIDPLDAMNDVLANPLARSAVGANP